MTNPLAERTKAFSSETEPGSPRETGQIKTRSSWLIECDQVAAGFFLAFGLAVFGSATGSDPRSIDVSRPAVKV